MKFSRTLQVFAATASIGSIASAQNAQEQDMPIQAKAPFAPVTQPEPPLAPIAPKFASETFEAMMGAIEDDKRAAFVAFADANFKAALTPPQFQQLSEQLASRLKDGHDFKYLGEMNQAGYVVYLWRVRFEDGGDDFLAQMSVKDNKVGGFFLR